MELLEQTSELKEKIILALQLITEAEKLNSKYYELFSDEHEFFLTRWDEIHEQVCQHFTGFSGGFRNLYTSSKLTFGYIPNRKPEQLGGFIGDAFTEVVRSKELTPEIKYNLLLEIIQLRLLEIANPDCILKAQIRGEGFVRVPNFLQEVENKNPENKKLQNFKQLLLDKGFDPATVKSILDSYKVTFEELK